jgi:hypothetical protein
MAEQTLMVEETGALSTERPGLLRQVNELMREGRQVPPNRSGSRSSANASGPTATSRSR